MEILICQSCGAILRSQGKSCKGCGALATRHTATALSQVTDPSGGALAVSLQNDPLVLERTVNHVIYGKAPGNGGSGYGSGYGGNGNGNGNGNGSHQTYPGTSSIPLAPTATTASIIGSRTGTTIDTEPPASESPESSFSTASTRPEPAASSENTNQANYSAATASQEPSGSNASPFQPKLQAVAEAGAAFVAGAVATREFFSAPAAAQETGGVAAPPAEARSHIEQQQQSLPPPAGPPSTETRPESRTFVPQNGESPQAGPQGQALGTAIEASTPSPAPQAPSGSESPPASPMQFFQGSSPPETTNSPEQAAPQVKPAESSSQAAAHPLSDAGIAHTAAEKLANKSDGMPHLAMESSPAWKSRTSAMDFFSAAPPELKPPGGDFSPPASESRRQTDGSAQESANERSRGNNNNNNNASDSSLTSQDTIARLIKSRTGEIADKKAKQHADDDDDDDDDDEDDDDEEVNSKQRKPSPSRVTATAGRTGSSTPQRGVSAPQRGVSALKTPNPKISAASKNEDDDDDDDDDDEDDDDDDDKKKDRKRDAGKDRPKRVVRNDRFKHTDGKKEPEKKVEIMGKTFSKSSLITTGIIAVVIGFPLIVLLSCVVSIISGAPQNGAGPVAQSPDQQQQQQQGQGGQQQQAAPTSAPSSMTGIWQYAYENVGLNGANPRPGKGKFQLTQDGSKLEGTGVDDNGQFQISGELQGDNARFNKQYVEQGKAKGKPILYAGKITVSQNIMQIAGTWELTKRIGFGWRATIATLGGRFGARLMQPGVLAEQSLVNPPIAMNGPGGGSGPAVGDSHKQQLGDLTPKDPKKAQDFYMVVAFGIISVGILLAMLSLRFFGPSGLLNIWAKKEYIPSQFKAQHFKMVKEMGKPMAPGSVPLGTREEWGWHQWWLPRKLFMPIVIREKNPHMFMIGGSATGKTRLMASMIAADIESNDRAVVVVDSDGVLADLLLNWVASRPNGADLAKRIIVVDPTYLTGEKLCYNPLEFPEDGDLQNAASALVSGFKAAYTEPPGAQSQWNQQTANILRNSSILLMANNKTLTSLPVLLSDNDFRDVMLEKIEQLKATRTEFITLLDAWTNYKRLARTDQWITWIEPILNRVQPMLSDPRIRSILTKEKSDLDLKKIISERKVLIVKIPQGQLDKNGNLLGSLLVAGVKQAALSLCSVKGDPKRRPCSLYLDEFESFIEKETFDAITTETRKLQIGFCGASKTFQTMPEEFRNKIIINVGIMCIFALAKKDGDMLGPQMFRVDGRKIKHQTIQNWINKVNSSPQFELIMDEEKLNIDRVVGQEKRTYFCYRVGSVAGVFRMKAPDFDNIAPDLINKDLLKKMHENRQHEEEDEDDDDEDEDDED